MLLIATKYSGAYYLTGYAIEFALRRIAKLTNQHHFYDRAIAKKEEACTRRACADDGLTASRCGLSGTGS